MKVTCPVSGIHYATLHPVRGTIIAPHPLLTANIPMAKLAEWYLVDWTEGKLTAVETHLLGVALLQKLPITSITFPKVTDENMPAFEQFWHGNIERMVQLVVRLEGKTSVIKSLPHLTVNPGTLAAVPDWLKDITNELNYRSAPITEKAKELNRDQYKESTVNNSTAAVKLLEPDQIENLVIRALRGSPLSTNEGRALPVILSDWALKVAPFPQHSIMRWQRIIQTIFNVDYINQLLMSDIKLEQVKALEAHLMENSPNFAVGTSHHSILMKRLAAVIPVLEDFNPVTSARKKVNEDDLEAALNGTSATQSKPQSVAPQKYTTLAEKLAARLAAAKVSSTKQINAGDL